MAQRTNGIISKIKKNGSRSNWLKAAGAVALMGAGILLYRKKQRLLGSALISGSVKMLTGAAAI
jgi:LPXTG-motif cell wall-anchored protein